MYEAIQTLQEDVGSNYGQCQSFEDGEPGKRRSVCHDQGDHYLGHF